MSRRPCILIDVDGPLTEGFFTLTCALLRDEGYPAYPRMIKGWDIFKAFDVPPPVEREVRRRLQQTGVAGLFPVRDGARDFLDELRRWADVYAVTAPLDGSPTWAYERERWLSLHMNIDREHVVFARDKSLIRGDAFVDDRHSLVVAWQEAHPEGIAILWREPHNADDSWQRVASTYDGLRAFLNELRP